MSRQYTVTFFSSGWGKHSFKPPIFKKVYTSANVILSDVVYREVSRKCEFVEVELNNKKIQHLSYIILKGKGDFKKGVKSVWYCFQMQLLVIELMLLEELGNNSNILVSIDIGLWEKSIKIMSYLKVVK